MQLVCLRHGELWNRKFIINVGRQFDIKALTEACTKAQPELQGSLLEFYDASITKASYIDENVDLDEIFSLKRDRLLANRIHDVVRMFGDPNLDDIHLFVYPYEKTMMISYCMWDGGAELTGEYSVQVDRDHNISNLCTKIASLMKYPPDPSHLQVMKINNTDKPREQWTLGEELLPATSLLSEFLNKDPKERFVAVREAIRNIHAYYDTLTNSSTNSPSFPYQTFYELPNKARVDFTYETVMQELIFTGREVMSAEHICIKFMKGDYALDAHNFAASVGLAPRLRGVFPLPGVWKMVVMDLLEGHNTLFEYLQQKGRNVTEENRAALKENVHNMANKLHEGGFVHGDLRDTNIMVDTGAPFGVSCKIVDFDWSGKIGVAKYPIDLNVSTIARPQGVSAGGHIIAEHDHQMIDEFLFTLKKPTASN